MSSRPDILVVEDDFAHWERIKTVATNYGVPINVRTTAEALAAIRSGQYASIVLDLVLAGASDARNTVDTFAVAGVDHTPIIVVTGFGDPNLRDYCRAKGWAYIDKDSLHFGRLLAESLGRAIVQEESGSFPIRANRDTQLESIVALLEQVQKEQKALREDFAVLNKQVVQVVKIVLGYRDENGLHVPGCYESHQPIAIGVKQLRINAWHLVGLAITVVVTSTVAALVASVIGG
jgi:CheY-like chemotaxis protein